jgi:Uma2 family endonuclease
LRRLTEGEYLEIERAAEFKSEFYQKEPRIEQFICQADRRWLLSEAAGLDATLEVASLQITLSLAEVFAQVTFSPTPIRAAIPPPRQPQ